MRVVIAPDSFKGTASAAEVAAALATGWRSVRPDDEIETIPMADGGEGSLDAFASAYPDCRWHRLVTSGPLAEVIESAWLELPGRVGVVELAASSGITMLPTLDPAHAHTTGLGQTIAAVIYAGMDEVVVCIGGSASNDGGAGMLSALGARLLDAEGDQIPTGAIGLDALVRVDLTELVPLPPRGVRVVTDVDAPLNGVRGAIRTYGAQKGVEPAEFDRYEQRLSRWAGFLGVDSSTPGAGAAGGTGTALLAWGATLQPGAGEVARQLGLDVRVLAADVVITGEGRFDGQSAAGKVPEYVARLAERLNVTTALVAGSITSSTAGFTFARSLTDLAGSATAAMSETAHWLVAAGRSLAEQAASGLEHR